MKKASTQTTINKWFQPKRKTPEISEPSEVLQQSEVEIEEPENRAKFPRTEINEFHIDSLERDPGKRRQIWEYDISLRDEVRRAYLKLGPYQPKLSSYPQKGNRKRSFQYSWFSLFSSWLEYSPSEDKAYCLPCFLFNKPSGHSGQKTFTVGGFQSWKKVRDGRSCAFLCHMGKDSDSLHKNVVRACEDLLKQDQHIQHAVEKYTSKQIADNRLRVRTSIVAVRWLALQGCSFRGHDESLDSINPGNFVSILNLIGSYNEKVAEVILQNAPKNASYTSPPIQKQILQAFSVRVRKAIRENIGDSKFSIIVDEARDESKKEQMSLVLRFVDKDGLIRERFFRLVHVKDTKASTLQSTIYSVLANHDLDIQNIRGQGYDGASNMRGEWNGLQALILKDCPYTYYVHCLAHRLQLALVAASREVIPIQKFYNQLAFIVNIIGVSCKRHDEFQVAQEEENEYLTSVDQLKTGRGLNQKGTLQRAGDTRWSSYYRSISSLRMKFSPVCQVLISIIEEGKNSLAGDADAAYESMTTYQFVFILHLMEEIMENTNELCLALQSKSQDILNVMRLVSGTKDFLQNMRDDGWNALLTKVNTFCEKRNIEILDMNAPYVAKGSRARNQDDWTMLRYYQVDIFKAAIDCQWQELNYRFNERSVELLILSSALDPCEIKMSFKIDSVCQLVEKIYPEDFADHEKLQLRKQLEFFEYDVVRDEEFKKISTISDIFQWLVKTRRSTTYPLVYRVIVLVLTLPVSTATAERSFSAMHIIKIRLRNRMGDDFLTDSLQIYIEKEIAKKFNIDSIIDDFRDMQERRVLF